MTSFILGMMQGEKVCSPSPARHLGLLHQMMDHVRIGSTFRHLPRFDAENWQQLSEEIHLLQNPPGLVGGNVCISNLVKPKPLDEALPGAAIYIYIYINNNWCRYRVIT